MEVRVGRFVTSPFRKAGKHCLGDMWELGIDYQARKEEELEVESDVGYGVPGKYETSEKGLSKVKWRCGA